MFLISAAGEVHYEQLWNAARDDDDDDDDSIDGDHSTFHQRGKQQSLDYGGPASLPPSHFNKTKPHPPPPPPRTGYKTSHARSSSLDLNRSLPTQPPPAVPPRFDNSFFNVLHLLFTNIVFPGSRTSLRLKKVTNLPLRERPPAMQQLPFTDNQDRITNKARNTCPRTSRVFKLVSMSTRNETQSWLGPLTNFIKKSLTL